MRVPGRASRVVLTGLAWLAGPRRALAGMPTVTLSDVARMRFQAVSFFLLVLLLCAWGVKGLWNALAADVPRLPRLTYGKALGVVALWGLLFTLILTMVSGARELMTPGAWVKQGFTYRLAEGPPPPPTDLDAARRMKLERLRDALRVYAKSHDGRYPPDDLAPEIEPEVWRLPGGADLRYLYVPGRILDQGDAVLACETGLFGRDRYVLFADGSIRSMDRTAVHERLRPVEGTP